MIPNDTEWYLNMLNNSLINHHMQQSSILTSVEADRSKTIQAIEIAISLAFSPSSKALPEPAFATI